MNRTIIEVTALNLFREHGYDAVRVRDICDACHITKPTFYHYVSSKEDLLITYYNTELDALECRLGEIPDADSWTQLCTSYNMLMDETERIGPDLLGRILAINLKENKRSFERRMRLTENMIAIIRRGQEHRELSNRSDPKRLCEASAYLYQGYELLWCVQNNEDWRVQFMESLKVLMLPACA